MRRTIDFLQLTAKLPYPPAVKGKLSTIHATIVNQVIESFTNKHTEKLKAVHAINCVSYMYMSSDALPFNWDVKNPLNTYRNIDDDTLREFLGDMYISTKDIDWTDVPVSDEVSDGSVPVETSVSVDDSTVVPTVPEPKPTILIEPIQGKTVSQPAKPNPVLRTIPPTDKSDLYIQPPVVPRFDSAHPYVSGKVGEVQFTVYPSYPLIPTKQNEISMTTDVDRMSDNDLKRLYPNCLIRTRATCMYESCDGIELDPKLGLILPIHGYTKKQLVDNIIKYPHIFRLLKQVNGSLESFYSTLEVDGELYKISDVWSTLPESGIIPYTKEFVKEYVVRRYLLERDIKGIEHKYPLYGSLDMFLTLFTSPDDYASMGYTNIIQMARDCVTARVNYKRSRNPVLRRLQDA